MPRSRASRDSLDFLARGRAAAAARGVKLTDGTHLVPVTFTVRNIGNAPAGAFAVKATYRLPTLGEDRWVALHSAGRQVTIPSLAAGASRVVRALVKGMRPETNPATITLHADSCIGDEFMPVHCNVLERSERNNSMLKVVYVE